jgi:hypothetical protein
VYHFKEVNERMYEQYQYGNLFISSEAPLCPIATKKGDKATNRRMQDIDKKTKPLCRCKIKPTRYNFIDHY